MRIAVCDDETSALKQTSNTVKKVFDEMGLKYLIDQFSDATEMLSSGKQYDVVFLDIELLDQNRNGVWAAKMLKKENKDCIIIFITNYEEYIDEVIEKYAFRYWSKPIDEYRLRKSIRSIIERTKNIITEEHGTKNKLKLPMRDIIYITPQGKHCKVVTIENEYIVTESFKEFKIKLTTQNFCECHGSYCVNLDFVENYTKTEVSMFSGMKKYTVHMSRRHYKNFKEQMFIMGGERV